MRLRLAALLTALSVTLSGCFISDEPLITLDNASFPFIEINYDAYPFTRFTYGADSVDYTDTFVRRGDRYMLANEGTDGGELLIYDAGDGLLIGQFYTPPAPGLIDRVGYAYGAALLKPEENLIILYLVEARPEDFGPGALECEPGNACLTDLEVLVRIAREMIATGARPVASLPIHRVRWTPAEE